MVNASGTKNACEQLCWHPGIQCNASNGQLWRLCNQHGLCNVIMWGEGGKADSTSADLFDIKLKRLFRYLLLTETYEFILLFWLIYLWKNPFVLIQPILQVIIV